MQITIPDILLKHGFGVRSLGFEIFEAVCEELQYKIFWTDEKLDDGLSFPRTRHGKKHRIIILRRMLFQQALVETAWHEFTHAYFEHFGVRTFVRGSEEKYERAADDFSLCCLIPTFWMRTKTRNMLLEEGFSNEQITRRKEIYDGCGV